MAVEGNYYPIWKRGESSAVSVAISDQNKNVKIELVERSNGRVGGVTLVNHNGIARQTEPSDLVDLARQVQKADEFVRARAVGKLELIADQMRHLQEQARKVLEDARRDDALHHAACNVKKVPGKVYALYERESGQKYFSMLLPQEWGDSCPHKCLGIYRLEHDLSWTPEEKIESRTREINLMDRILTANRTFDHAIEANTTPKPLVLEMEGPLKLD